MRPSQERSAERRKGKQARDLETERALHATKTQSQIKGQRERKEKERKTEQTEREKVLREGKIFWSKKNPHKLSIEPAWELHLDSALSNFQAARHCTYLLTMM